MSPYPFASKENRKEPRGGKKRATRLGSTKHPFKRAGNGGTK